MMRFFENGRKEEFEITVDGLTVGKCTLLFPELSNFNQAIYMKHFEIYAEHRSHGIGTKILWEIEKEFGSFFFAPDSEDAKRWAERNAKKYIEDAATYFDKGFGVYYL